MTGGDDRAVDSTEALAPVEAVVVEDDDTNPAACTLCGGPVRICGGTRRCMGGHLGPVERRWVTAIRLVYAGLCLTPPRRRSGAVRCSASPVCSRGACRCRLRSSTPRPNTPTPAGHCRAMPPHAWR